MAETFAPLPFRARCAAALCNAARRGLHLLGRGGTNLPGKLALKLDPALPAELSRGLRIIAVSGTNGKTTTCRMLAAALEHAGIPVLTNRSGANLRSGVTALLAENIRRGKPQKRVAVIECDEAAWRTLGAQLKPEILVVTNVFRDQLDRYGEVLHTLSEIEEGAAAAPGTLLCLNADDSLVADLSRRCSENAVLFYGMDTSGPAAEKAPSERSDAMYCIRCGAKYDYDYRTYAHLGGFRCPGCGYRRPDAAVAVTAIERLGAEDSTVELRIGETAAPQRVPLPAVYNVYNLLAAAAGLHAFGLDPEAIRAGLDTEAGFGRMEHFDIGAGVTMILVKNPAGFTQVLDYLSGISNGFDLLCCLNDRAQDGRDISWIWDVPLERLADGSTQVQEVFAAGTRGEEMLLRLKHAGISPEKLRLAAPMDAFLRGLSARKSPLVIVPTYTAMMALRPKLARMTGAKAFWE